jgi:hypothetical protein
VACHGDVHDSSAAGDDSQPTGGADDSATIPGDDTSEGDNSCEKLEVRYDGPDQPHVGDQWTLQLWCDDALMTMTVIRFDPSDFASVSDGNVATFLQAGEGTIQMQAGTDRAYRDVTVWE